MTCFDTAEGLVNSWDSTVQEKKPEGSRRAKGRPK